MRAKEQKIPQNLEEALEILEDLVDPEERERIKEMDLNSFIGQAHHGVGRWIRNNWGFWREEGTLYKDFVGMGLHHADDMSGVVLTSYWRRLKGNDLDIEGQIQKYKDYWSKTENNEKE